MNDDRVTSLVSELIAFEETLKEHEADLRVLVSHMVTGKPEVVADATFARDLRARLLSNHVRGILSPYQKAERWAFRLVPLGMVALLVLMLFPERTHYIPHTPSPDIDDVRTEVMNQDVSPKEASTEDSYDMNVQSVPTDAPTFSGGNDMNTHESMDSRISSPSETAPHMMKTGEPPAVPAPFTIDPQRAGPRIMVRQVTVTTPSFIVIYTYDRTGQEIVFGVSPLLRPGSTEQVPIYTHTPTRSEGTYYALLHEDNGNRLFTKTEDVPLTDGYGNPVIVSIVIE